MKNLKSHDNIEMFVQKMRKQILSDEGIKALLEALKKADEAKKELEKKRKIEPQSLFDPMTL